MREIALYDAKNSLSALIQEVEATGEEIMITRHGKPTAKLCPVTPASTRTRAESAARLRALRNEAERRHPTAERLSWEALKCLMRDEEDNQP